MKPRNSRARNPLHEISSSSSDGSANQAHMRPQSQRSRSYPDQSDRHGNEESASQKPCAHYSGNMQNNDPAASDKEGKNGNGYMSHSARSVCDLARSEGTRNDRQLPPLVLTINFYTHSGCVILDKNLKCVFYLMLKCAIKIGNGVGVVIVVVIGPKDSTIYTIESKNPILPTANRSMSRSPKKKSRMALSDATYTVLTPPTPFPNPVLKPVLDTSNLDSSGMSPIRSNLQTLAVTINVNDDTNNNDTIGGPGPTGLNMGSEENVLARDRAITAMEAAMVSPTSSVEIIDTEREMAGMAGASSLARAAVATALAEQQRDRTQPDAAEPRDAAAIDGDGDEDIDNSVFYDNTIAIDSNEEVGNFTPTNPFSPFTPPTTPNLHPCQAPLFVSYTNCGHDYTRSDERIVYDGSSSGSSPNFRGEWCSPNCHIPKRCLRHFPITHGCPTCMPSPESSSSELDYHPNINGTPAFIRVGEYYPEDDRPTYINCETGMLSEIQWIYSPVYVSPIQDWVDATPSSTSTSDVEKHEEIRRQAVNTDDQIVSPRAKSFTIVEVQPVLIVKSKLIQRLFQFQGSSSSIAVDHPVDEWSLAQIRNGNNDQRFLEATRPQRKAMMAKGMWPLVTPDPVVLPCHSDHDDVDYEERRIRHRSGDESNDDVHMYVELNAEATAMEASAMEVFDGQAGFDIAGGHVHDGICPSTSASEMGQAASATSAVSPPVLLSIVDTGINYTQVLHDLIVLGMHHTEAEVLWSEASEKEKREASESPRILWRGLSQRMTYLEAAHDLLINGFTARDVTVTDATDASYTTADEDQLNVASTIVIMSTF